MDLETLKYYLIDVAVNSGWENIESTHEYILLFKRVTTNGFHEKLNVYLSIKGLKAKEPNFTLQSRINHPLQGVTQLTRRGLTVADFSAICIEPRLHTNKGYYQRKWRR